MTKSPRNLDTDALAKAVALYLRFAYTGADKLPARARVEIDPHVGLQDVLAGFERDTGCAAGRHVLRLGNHVYPHMKLAVERARPGGRWYLAVDCHDGALGDCAARDRDAWEGVRLQNAAIKAAIETAWAMEGLPTVRRNVTRMVEREHQRSPAAGSLVAGAGCPVGIDTRPLVMVVDDEEELAELFAIYLRQGGFRTEVVTDSRLALEAARRLKPNLFLLDYMMPEVSGHELCSALRADAGLSMVPRIICTYAALGGDAAACADEVLAKPVDRGTLIARVNSHLAASLACVR